MKHHRALDHQLAALLRNGRANSARLRVCLPAWAAGCIVCCVCCLGLSIRNMHFKRWRRLRDGAPAPWQADTNAYKQRFWCHDRPRSEKNGGFGYARGIFHEETMSVYR
eukprot:scaffold25993_cov31-Phaeocystis_antarctica.AAC.1